MAEVTIKARTNGPYKVEGPVRVIDAEGNEFVLPEGSPVVLCRCGQSASKPFCDKSHRRIGFVADDSAPRVPG
jgi:CDGSH-type Zn-finger protein